MQFVFIPTITQSKYLKKKTTISDLNGQFVIKKHAGFNNFKIINTNYAYPDKKNRGKFITDFLDQL